MHRKVTKTEDIFNIDGVLLTSEPLWRHTTFNVGGPADLYAVPVGEADLSRLLRGARAADLPVFILGGGSNLLVSDKGIRGLVIDMKEFDEFRIEGDSPASGGFSPAGKGMSTAGTGDTPEGGKPSPESESDSPQSDGSSTVILGAGLEVSGAAWKAGSLGFSGLEFIFGMPGSVGGAVWMNARCYNGEISESFAWADVMDRDGNVRRIEKKEEDWEYKISPFQGKDDIILRAAFRAGREDPAILRRSMTEKRDDREAKGHFRSPCAGSAFKNNRAFGEPSGVLIDKCGLKGYRLGGAAVSDWHGNIVINDRGAKASEIRDLLTAVSDKVEETTGFRMEAEVQAVGDWEK